MMRMSLREGVMALGLALAGVSAAAQTVVSPKVPMFTTDVAVTYTLERSKTTVDSCNCFWLNGGSVDAAVTFRSGLGVAVNVGGASKSNVNSGVGFSKISYMAGPRYTWNTSKWTKKRGSQIFGEGLFGAAHGFNSVFPGPAASTSTANAFSLQAGGGVDIALAKGFSVRALEADYVLTNFSNNAQNQQNDFRLAFGVSYRH